MQECKSAWMHEGFKVDVFIKKLVFSIILLPHFSISTDCQEWRDIADLFYNFVNDQKYLSVHYVQSRWKRNIYIRLL